MYKISLGNYHDQVYFIICKKQKGSILNTVYDTSKSISKLFDMELDEYNDLVIDKVIGSANYTIGYLNTNKESDIYHDLMFEDKKSKKFYVDKFKEVFAPQLILLTIEG